MAGRISLGAPMSFEEFKKLHGKLLSVHPSRLEAELKKQWEREMKKFDDKKVVVAKKVEKD